MLGWDGLHIFSERYDQESSLLCLLLTLLTHLLSFASLFVNVWEEVNCAKTNKCDINVISSRANDTIHFFLWHILLLVIIATAIIAVAFGRRQTMASSRTLQSIGALFLSYLVCSAHWALCKQHTTLLALSSYPVLCPVCSVQEKRYTRRWKKMLCSALPAKGSAVQVQVQVGGRKEPTGSPSPLLPALLSSNAFKYRDQPAAMHQCRDQPAANTSSGSETRSAATLITQSVA